MITLSPTTESLLADYALRTGLSSTRQPKRYLWTDAFAVCAFLSLYRRAVPGPWKDLSAALVDQVHHVLGRHRDDDSRTGWISGLDEAAGEAHPTIGGLRIGKPLPEGQLGDRPDPRLEWDRDGQYFHYLTKWMHAMVQMATATRQPEYAQWARELAVSARNHFVIRAGGQARSMYWKMSVDLSRPLVPSMGHHDPLDGFITCAEITALTGENPELSIAQTDFADLCINRDWTTSDPLGLGGLLCDAWRLAQLNVIHGIDHSKLVEAMLEASLTGLSGFVAEGHLNLPASQRLAFRELGLSIGLHALTRLCLLVNSHQDARRLRSTLEGLKTFQPLTERIESFWIDSQHRSHRLWREHQDINDVMLSTSLMPDGFLNFE